MDTIRYQLVRYTYKAFDFYLAHPCAIVTAMCLLLCFWIYSRLRA